ncbi:hypothetical protein [Salinibaculum rarum]|uniref:hypothetical protein n=1 Tax=Salinibaculum rarum TaxID=3058903 RepID=UPI00265FD1E6|nr:hypothetical protein [Salinibaculum sp. KK48]
MDSRRVAKAAGVSVGAFALFGIITGLVPNSIYTRMVPRTGLDYLFLGLTAVFLGAYTYQRTNARGRDDTTVTAGAVLGFLAFGCPVCNSILLALFSSSALMTYLDPVRPLLGAVSVLLFAGLLYARSRRTCVSCAGEQSAQPQSD